MARRKMEQLRDDVIAAANEWHVAWSRARLGDETARTSANLGRAVNALNAYITPIIDSPGEYVEGSPETSRNAALQASPLAGSVRRQIVDEIWSVQFWHEGYGLTDSDLEARLKGKHQTVSSARNWLLESGWVVDSGKRKMSPSKRLQVVWVLTPAAVAKMKENAA